MIPPQVDDHQVGIRDLRVALKSWKENRERTPSNNQRHANQDARFEHFETNKSKNSRHVIKTNRKGRIRDDAWLTPRRFRNCGTRKQPPRNRIRDGALLTEVNADGQNTRDGDSIKRPSERDTMESRVRCVYPKGGKTMSPVQDRSLVVVPFSWPFYYFVLRFCSSSFHTDDVGNHTLNATTDFLVPCAFSLLGWIKLSGSRRTSPHLISTSYKKTSPLV